MTDAELVAKKLAFIETSCRELRQLADLERIRTDVRERRFVEDAATGGLADLERLVAAVRCRL